MTIIANVNRSSKTKEYKVENFLLHLEGKKPQSWQEQLQIVQMLNKAFNSKNKKKE